MSGMNIQQERITVGSSDFTLTEKLGEGAEGAIYRLPSSNEVVKIFEKEKREEKSEKVQAMIANNPTDPTYQQSNSDIRSIVWPTAIVEHPDTGDFLGYTMAYKNLADHKNACRYARENLQWNPSDPEDRYKTALNLVRVVRAIHEQGHAIGDLNHQNILIDSGYVSVIDCDAFHIKGTNEAYSDDVYFPRYAPPEGRGNTLRGVRRGDRFGIAVHIFQLLMEGFHPFQAQGEEAAEGSYGDMIQENRFPYVDPKPGKIEPHSAAPDYNDLPTEIRELFSKCFCKAAKKHPLTRPPLRMWKETLESETDEQKVIDPDRGQEEQGETEIELPDWVDDTDTTNSDDSESSTDPDRGQEEQEETKKELPDWVGDTDTTNSDDSESSIDPDTIKKKQKKELPDWVDDTDTTNSDNSESSTDPDRGQEEQEETEKELPDWVDE